MKEANATYKLIGLSTDTKPAPAPYPVGSTFYETDTGDTYVLNSAGAWVLKTESARSYIWNPSTLAWEAEKQSTVVVDSLNVSGVAVSNWPFLVTEQYDSVELGYTGDKLTSAVYKNGLATVATLTLTYSGDTLTGVSKT